jgi:hypothetical protein
MEELTNKLLSKAQRSLYNLSEVTQELCLESLQEAMELTQNKPIQQTMLLDLALMRLKLNLKTELTEFEEKQMLFIIKKADEMKIDAVTLELTSYFSAGARESEWDM